MSAVFNHIGDYLLEVALSSECRRAGLVGASVRLSFGHIEYLQSGNETDNSLDAIVMLHGATADKTSWIPFARLLGRPFRLVIPDLPGHGKSIADLNLNYSIDAQTDRLKELLARLGIKRVHLIGNSMGGAIAIHLASTSPDLVSSLVLIDAAGVEASQSWLGRHVARTGINPMIESDYRAMMRIGMEAPPYIPGIILSALARDFARRKAINQKIARDIERDLDQTESLSKITAPSLIIWGAADKIFHVDNAELLHQRLANSRKIVMEGIGHVPMVEAPKQVAAACKSFFADMAQ